MLFEGNWREGEWKASVRGKRSEGKEEGMHNNIQIWIYIGNLGLYYIFYYYLWSSEKSNYLPLILQDEKTILPVN